MASQCDILGLALELEFRQAEPIRLSVEPALAADLLSGSIVTAVLVLDGEDTHRIVILIVSYPDQVLAGRTAPKLLVLTSEAT